ncbi:MAG: enterochelin esterase, partial [Actinobacteria bacterium]|nr:enterochelin esterase [Actinomycetota bacterium]
MSVAAGPRRPPGRPKQPPPTVVPSPRVERLARELSSGPAATARFWEEVRHEGTPLVEPAEAVEERVVTFLWRDP